MYESIIFRGREYNVWESDHFLFKGERRKFVHLFGEMDLPLEATYEQAWEVANNAAECCGYLANKQKPNKLVCMGHDRCYVVTYENDKLKDVEDMTIQYRIDDLEAWNETWRGRIREIEHQLSHPEVYRDPTRKADYYQKLIDDNNARIEVLKGKLSRADSV